LINAPSLELIGKLERGGIRLLRVDTIRPEPYRWLWRNRIPAAGLTMFSGPPDAGKSTIYCDVAARVSAGRTMPGDSETSEQPKPGNVLILASEDHYASVVAPRLAAAGADLSRICLIDCVLDDGFEAPLVLDESGLRRLSGAIEAVQPRLVVIDPYTNHFPLELDSYRDPHIRRVLGPIALHGLHANFSLLVTRHFTQDGRRGAGSVALAGLARSELHAKKADGRGTLTVYKRNNTVGAEAIHYRFVSVGDVARLEWEAGGEASEPAHADEAQTTSKLNEDHRVALGVARDTGHCTGPELCEAVAAAGRSIAGATANRRLVDLEGWGLMTSPVPGRGRSLTERGAAELAGLAA
jgi:hypothetical protein